MSNGVLTPASMIHYPTRPDSPQKIPFNLNLNNNNNNNLDSSIISYNKENFTQSTSSLPSPLQQSQLQQQQQPLTASVIARYAHPHSPNPSHISHFVSQSSPKLNSTTTSAYTTACSSPNLFQSTSASSSPQFNSHQFTPTFISSSTSSSSSSSNNNFSSSTSMLPPPTSSYLASSYSRPMPPLPPPSPLLQSSYRRPIQIEPTMTQLLSEQPSSMSSYNSRLIERDSTMGAATGVASWRKGQGFKEWEKVRLDSPEVRRKADVAQLCWLHFFLSFRELFTDIILLYQQSSMITILIY